METLTALMGFIAGLMVAGLLGKPAPEPPTTGAVYTDPSEARAHTKAMAELLNLLNYDGTTASQIDLEEVGK